MLTIAHLSLAFGGLQALHDVGFDVAAGEIVGLIGPNGAGKTTLLNCLSRFYEPDTGSIHFAGTDLRRCKPHEVVRLGIARTFQNLELFAGLSVLDNVLVGCHVTTALGRSRTSLGPLLAAGWRLPSARQEEQALRRWALEVLDFLDLSHVAAWPAVALPYGLRKRVELARALVVRPRLLLLDEPAGGLNPQESQDLAELLRRIRTTFGCALLLVEHDMVLVMGLCERVIVLDFGRVIASGTPDEVQNNPAVIEAYLGAPENAESR